MKRLLLNITEEEHRELKVRAAKEGTTMTAIVRKALGFDE